MASRGGVGGRASSGGGAGGRAFLGFGLGFRFAFFAFFFGFFFAFLGKISHLRVDTIRCLQKIDKFWVSFGLECVSQAVFNQAHNCLRHYTGTGLEPSSRVPQLKEQVHTSSGGNLARRRRSGRALLSFPIGEMTHFMGISARENRNGPTAGSCH